MKMNNQLNKLFLVLFTILINFASYSDELFYKHSSYGNFKKSLSQYAGSLDKKKANEDMQHSKQIAVVFTTKALEAHSDYLNKAIKDYRNFKKTEQEVLLQAFYNIKNNEIIETLSEDKNLVSGNDISKKIDEMNFITKDNIQFGQEDLNYNSNLADYLWSAFYATGNDKYILKMLDFVHAWPKDLQTLAWEMLNRDSVDAMKKLSGGTERDLTVKYKDIFEGVKKSGKANVDQLKSLYIVLWSLESNAKQHPELKKIIKF